MFCVKRSVAGIALEGEKFFIARRKEGGDLGGKWEFPGGKVEPGENDEHALLREYFEEFGVGVRAGPFLARSSFEHNKRRFLLFAYQVFFEEEAFQNLRLAEHSAWQWAALDDIENLNHEFVDSDRMLLPALKMYLEKQRHIKK